MKLKDASNLLFIDIDCYYICHDAELCVSIRRARKKESHVRCGSVYLWLDDNVNAASVGRNQLLEMMRKVARQ